MVWRDLSNTWQDYCVRRREERRSGSARRRAIARRGRERAAVRSPPSRRRTASSGRARSRSTWGTAGIARTARRRFAFGIRQPEQEHGAENPAEFRALQRAPRDVAADAGVFLRQCRRPDGALRAALAFTRQDRFKPLPGYQVMATHFHTSASGRLPAWEAST